MYTVESLKEMFKKRLEAAAIDPTYGSKPEPLFNEDGAFNNKNWNSGQDVIRDKLFHIIYPGAQFISVGTDLGVVSADVIFDDDQWYIDIDIMDEGADHFESYIVTWYKNRGRTGKIVKNGDAITIEEYVDLLNKLEQCNFFSDDKWE